MNLPSYGLEQAQSSLKVPASHQTQCTGGQWSLETRSRAKPFLFRSESLGRFPENSSKVPLPHVEPTSKHS